jgi:hypothetical protein
MGIGNLIIPKGFTDYRSYKNRLDFLPQIGYMLKRLDIFVNPPKVDIGFRLPLDENEIHERVYFCLK